MKLDSGFFRQEAARLLATLTRAFGMANLALAEDVVQETLADAFGPFETLTGLALCRTNRLLGSPNGQSEVSLASNQTPGFD